MALKSQHSCNYDIFFNPAGYFTHFLLATEDGSTALLFEDDVRK